MAGRHSLIAPSKSFFSKSRTGFLTATAAGAVVGVGMPVASANPQEVPVTNALSAIKVETAAAEIADFGVPTIELEASTGAEWKIDEIAFEVDAPVAEAEIEETRAEAQAEAQEVAVTAQETASAQPAAATTQAAGQATAAQSTASATTEATVAAAPAAPAPAASGIVGIARQYSGVPYVYGGTTPAGWDCSGFTSYVYAQAGINLPRSSSAQLNSGYRVSASQARPGDLVWWPGHVGIYTGNGQHIAARNPSSGTYEGPVYGSPVYVRIAG